MAPCQRTAEGRACFHRHSGAVHAVAVVTDGAIDDNVRQRTYAPLDGMSHAPR